MEQTIIEKLKQHRAEWEQRYEAFIAGANAAKREIEETDYLLQVHNKRIGGKEIATAAVLFPITPLTNRREGRRGRGRSADSNSLRQIVRRKLEEANKYIHVSEIYDLIKADDPKSTVTADAVSRALTNIKAKSGLDIDIVVKGMRANTFWGFKKYKDNDGEIKPEHMYNTSLIKTSFSKTEK